MLSKVRPSNRSGCERVARCAELPRERANSFGQPLGVVVQNDFCHLTLLSY